MSHVEVREGESLHHALIRFRHQVGNQFSRSWYKTRVGYYEKPGTRRRRKASLAQMNRRCPPGVPPLKMKMGLTWLYRRKQPWP